jgi:lipopolysaccharide export system ATP-binding protein
VAQLIASNLAKAYKGREVVQDVSLEINSGQIVGLLGPNGAGKTTCFYMIVGIIPADRGSISINGEDITNLAMHERARRGIGYLPQEASIFRKLSVGDNILSILETRPDLNKKQRLERCDQLLDEFHVSHLRESLWQWNPTSSC